MEITYKNWLTNNIAERLTNRDAPFTTTVELYKPEKLGFYDACVFTLNKVPSKRPMFLSFSGGTDSEYLIRFLVEQKVDFIPLVVNSPLNPVEFLNSLKVCKELGVSPHIIKVTANDFFKLFISEIYKKLNGIGFGMVPVLLTARYAAEKGGLILTGNHLQDEYQTVGDHEESILDIYEYDAYNQVLVPDTTIHFFYHTIEIVRSMAIESPQVDFSRYKCKFYGIAERRKSSYQIPFKYKYVWDEIIERTKNLKQRDILMTKKQFIEATE